MSITGHSTPAMHSHVDAGEKAAAAGKVIETVEVPPRFELGNGGFADHCLTTWLWHRVQSF